MWAVELVVRDVKLLHPGANKPSWVRKANRLFEIYTIEASCHAPDPVACYTEIKRVLKPGQLFVGYEWCTTDAYYPGNKDHKRMKEEIELGNGLQDIRSTCQILMEEDLAKESQVPWYQPLDPNHFSLSTLRLPSIGRFFTHNMVRAVEAFRIAPKGSTRVSSFLEQGLFGFVDGGQKYWKYATCDQCIHLPG